MSRTSRSNSRLTPTSPRDYIGPLDFVGDLPAAAGLLQAAWELVADRFARAQVAEYDRSLRTGERPRQRLHPWTPGLHWHVVNVNTGHSGPVPQAALSVVRDMRALQLVPDALPRFAREVADRIARQGERALWEARVAAQYAAANIRAEWSAVTDSNAGAPDVWIPAFDAEIQVKTVTGLSDPVTQLRPVFRALDAAQGQLARRSARHAPGPGAIVLAVVGAVSLDSWRPHDSLFYRSMALRLAEPAYDVVSALVFVTEQEMTIRSDGYQFMGNPAYWIVNPGAAHAWPTRLPLVVDE